MNGPTSGRGTSTDPEGRPPSAMGDRPSVADHLNFGPYVDALKAFLTQAEPPLTVSVEGAWGAGKSSFMLQLERDLRENGHFTVYFNPWRYESEEAVWAAFMLTFLDQVKGDLSTLDRWYGHLRLIERRSRGRRSRMLLKFGAAALATVVGVFLLQLVSDLLETDVFGVVLESLLSVLGIVSITGLSVAGLFLWVRKNVVGRAENELRTYLTDPEYEDRVSFIHHFHEEFDEILDAYIREGRPVYVFIDDLDRCAAPKAAELMQSINLMLSEDQRLVFLMGMDRGKVSASIAAKHKDLLEYLNTESDPGFGLDYGFRFIEKFVQIPFRIPRPAPENVEEFIGAITTDHRRSADRTDGRESIRSVRPTSPRTYLGETDAVERRVDGWSRSRLHATTGWVAPVLEYNPRQIKRFVNLFTLYALLANEVGFLASTDGEDEMTPPGGGANGAERNAEATGSDEAGTAERESGRTAPALTLEQIGKFVAMRLRWRIVDELERNPTALTTLSRMALRRRYWRPFREVLAERIEETGTDLAELDGVYRELLEADLSNLSPGLRSAEEVVPLLDLLHAGVYADSASSPSLGPAESDESRLREIRDVLDALGEESLERNAERFFERVDPNRIERLSGANTDVSLTGADLEPLLQLSPKTEPESETEERRPFGEAAGFTGEDSAFAGETDESMGPVLDREALKYIGSQFTSDFRRSLGFARKTFFTKPRSTHPGVVVPLSEVEVAELLGKHHFEPAWEQSHAYREEVLNMRRVEYVDRHPEFPEYEWWQTHVRGYTHDDGFELVAHFETYSDEYRRAYENGIGLDVERGLETLKDLLGREGVEYREIRTEGSGRGAGVNADPDEGVADRSEDGTGQDGTVDDGDECDDGETADREREVVDGDEGDPE